MSGVLPGVARAFCSSSSSSMRSGVAVAQQHQLQDQIVMKGMTFYAFHGARKEENVLGQRFVLDATLWADLSAAGHSDALQDTLDYTKAYSAIKRIVEGAPKQLQEAVAEEVCQQLLDLDPRVTAVQVYMRKPHVPICGMIDSIGVQLFRSKTG